MKKVLFISLILFFNIVNSQKFVSENTSYIDFNINEIKITVNENLFSGRFEILDINFKKYILISNNSKTLLLDFGRLIPSDYSKYFIENVVILNSNDISSIKKNINKTNNYVIDKIEIDYEGKNDRDNYTMPSGEFKYFWGDKFYSERELEKEKIKKEQIQKKIDNYNNLSNLNAYLGVYEVSIYTFHGVKLNPANKGKIYVTEEGITLISDLIIDDNTLRGSHIKDSFFTPSKEGEFYCKVSKGLWDEFTCFINLKSKSGAITTSIGKEFRTTTFSIIKKLD
ncbi:hypothetical protein [Flavobacterium sp.]|uniref:hypothetical protein n=1 Tax=Flavobacterium sp. TaxID=239 RepID=UPI00262C7D83|nr:hypothetical protein [Flavobacterium sp.]